MTQAFNLSQFANFLNTSGQVSASGIQSGVVPASPIPVGTVMLFYQSAAPTGWTQVTTQNNKALRVVSGTGGGTGGTTAFSTVFANQSITIGATTLSISQMPSHTHTYYETPYEGGSGFQIGDGIATQVIRTTSAQGGGGSHTHSGGTVTLDVQYIDVIIASKN
jgi:hypothetical protein